MKDFKSFLIGFLMCACMFLFMGQTKSNEGKEYRYDNISNLGYFDKETGDKVFKHGSYGVDPRSVKTYLDEGMGFVRVNHKTQEVDYLTYKVSRK